MTIAISSWSAISPFGYGRDTFADGVNTRRDTSTPVAAEWSVPDERACVVPDFDIRALLGHKGTRGMNRVAALAVATAGQLIDDVAARGPGLASRDDTGLVLGTDTGSVQSMMSFTRASLLAEKPSYVEPANVPSCVPNYAAGQVAIWHRLRGPNATVAAGRATGLVALNYARRLLLTGRVGQVLCGAAEEYSTERSWLEYQRRGDGRIPGEGCALVLLEPEANVRDPLASLVAVESYVCPDGDTAGAVAAVVGRLLTANNVRSSDVWSACGDERAVLQEIFGATVASRAPSADLIGDTSAATAAFQLVVLLSVSAADRPPPGSYAIVAAADPDGSVACALLRLFVDQRGGHRG